MVSLRFVGALRLVCMVDSVAFGCFAGTVNERE